LNCDQNQLELKTMETLKCANDHYKELEEMFKPNSISNTLKNSPLGCDFIDRDVACIVDHLGTCFPDEITNDVATMIDAAYETSEYVSCDRHGGNRNARLQVIEQRIARKYRQYPTHKALMDNIIQLDQNCDEQAAIVAFGQDQQCFRDNAEPSFQKASEAFVGAYYFSTKTSMPVCKGVTETLKCFNMNGCLTDREREFLENLAATFYKFIMNEFVRIQDDFGSFSSLLMAIGEENTPVFMEEYKDGLASIDLMLEMFTEDYKTPSCQQSLGAWKDCTSDCAYQPKINP